MSRSATEASAQQLQTLLERRWDDGDLLVHLRGRGPDTARRSLFVVDGAKAWRAALDALCGTGQAVQRCRARRVRNVVDHPARDQQAQAGVRQRTGRVTRWRNGGPAARWVAASFLVTAQSFRTINGDGEP